MDWRELIKLGSVDEPLTIDMIRNKEIKKGDYITPVGDLPLLATGEILFKGGKYYEVMEVKTSGLIVKSEKSPHYIHFDSPDGGAQWFHLSHLSNDEKLGVFESLPMDILILLSNHKRVSRSSIISELQLQYYSEDKSEQAKLKNDIIRSLILLQNQGYIEASSVIGKYEISDRGRAFLKGK